MIHVDGHMTVSNCWLASWIILRPENGGHLGQFFNDVAEGIHWPDLDHIFNLTCSTRLCN